MGHPVSVQGVDNMHPSKMNTIPALARGPQQPSNFWEFLRSWGGEWMWDRVEDSQATKHDLSWLFAIPPTWQRTPTCRLLTLYVEKMSI
jgi:hypothetical protein